MRNSGRFLIICLLACLLAPYSYSQAFASTAAIGSMSASTEENIDPSLVAVGAIGAANVYYSYLAIGSAADSFVSGTYDAGLAIAISNEVIFLNEGVIKSLQAMIAKNGLSTEDKNALRFLVETYGILNLQAKELVTFITDKKNDGAGYQEYRSSAWARIQKLFDSVN